MSRSFFVRCPRNRRPRKLDSSTVRFHERSRLFHGGFFQIFFMSEVAVLWTVRHLPPAAGILGKFWVLRHGFSMQPTWPDVRTRDVFSCCPGSTSWGEKKNRLPDSKLDLRLLDAWKKLQKYYPKWWWMMVIYPWYNVTNHLQTKIPP